VLVVGGALTAQSGLAASYTTSGAPSSPPHIMVIVDENTAYTSSDGTPFVVGNAKAPYINNSLVSQYASATQWYSVEHNSPKDYYDLISGSDQAGQKQPYKATTLVTELASAGITWKAYMEGAPSACYTGKNVNNYAKSHNPFIAFADVAKNPAQCANVVPYTQTQLSTDLNSTSPPDFVWITPNECSDMHSNCSPQNNKVAQGDQWLQNNLPIVLSSPWYASGGIIIVTWDESVIKDTSGGSEGSGGHIATLVISAKSTGSFTSPGDHYATLRGIEEAYGVGLLGNSSNPAFGDLKPAFGGGGSTPGTISGTVTDSDTPQPNTPVASVTVTCTCTGTPQTTDANGTYTFSSVTPGTYSLTFADSNAPGYVTQTVSNVTVASGTTTTQNAGLTEIDSVSGTVTDAQTGAPIAGATINCIGAVHGSSDCPTNNPASTTSAGFYYLTGTLPADNPYTLTVSATGYVTQTISVIVPSGNQAAPQNVALNEVAPAPPTVVQDVDSAAHAAGTSFSVATGSTAGGDLIAISAELDAGSGKTPGSITAITDNKGDLWTRAVAIKARSRIAAEIWYVPSAAVGVNLVTVAFSKTVNPVVRFYEISGASALDQTSSRSAKSTSPNTGTTGTTSTASEIVVGVISFPTTTAVISGLSPSFTDDALVRNTLSNFNNSEQAGHEVISMKGTLSYAGTLSGSLNWTAALATFR